MKLAMMTTLRMATAAAAVASVPEELHEVDA